MKVYLREEWEKEAIRRFGEDKLKWKFVCPSCGFEASVQDYLDAGVPSGAVGFSCIGRWLLDSTDIVSQKKGKPCNYAGGGFYKLNPVEVDGTRYFDFAKEKELPCESVPRTKQEKIDAEVVQDELNDYLRDKERALERSR